MVGIFFYGLRGKFLFNQGKGGIVAGLHLLQFLKMKWVKSWNTTA